MSVHSFAACCRNQLIGPSLILMLTIGTTAAQAPPTLHATVGAAVTQTGSLFTYVYTVANNSASQFSVARVTVDVTLPTNGSSLSGSGLNNGHGFLDTIAAQVSKLSTPPMVPIALSAPLGWLCTPAVTGTAQWFSSDPTSQIVPGRALGGYQIVSPGTPGIRTIAVEPVVDVDDLDVAPPEDDSRAQISAYLAKVDAARTASSFRTVTVAPTSPPANFNASDFIGTIIGYKEQAIQQGWIRDRGIGINLDAKLLAAREALRRGQTREAVNVLRSLLREIDERGEKERNDKERDRKELSPEAVALLKFNTEYLIDQISSPRPPPGDKDRNDNRR